MSMKPRQPSLSPLPECLIVPDFVQRVELGYTVDNVKVTVSMVNGVIYEFDSFDAYHAACEQNPLLRGVSPGGARDLLGTSRQNIYNAVKRGALDMVRITEWGTGPYLIIPMASIERYDKESLGRPGPRPGLRQRAQLAVDKVVLGVWPADV